MLIFDLIFVSLLLLHILYFYLNLIRCCSERDQCQGYWLVSLRLFCKGEFILPKFSIMCGFIQFRNLRNFMGFFIYVVLLAMVVVFMLVYDSFFSMKLAQAWAMIYSCVANSAWKTSKQQQQLIRWLQKLDLCSCYNGQLFIII